jgi:hypothetical protein
MRRPTGSRPSPRGRPETFKRSTSRRWKRSSATTSKSPPETRFRKAIALASAQHQQTAGGERLFSIKTNPDRLMRVSFPRRAPATCQFSVTRGYDRSMPHVFGCG